MTGCETEFVPKYSLFYTHKGRKKLFELLGVHSHKEFMDAMNEMQKKKGISEEVYEKLVFAGLIWKHPDITMDDVEDLIEQFSLMGNGFEDLDDVITDALVNSGLYNGMLVEAFRQLKKKTMNAEEIEKSLENIAKAQKGTAVGDDMGEDPAKSPTSKKTLRS